MMLLLIFGKENRRCKNSGKICSSRVSIDKLKESFKTYQDRIKRNNNILLMRIIYYLSPLSFFRPVYIFLKDYGKTFEIDYVQNNSFN